MRVFETLYEKRKRRYEADKMKTIKSLRIVCTHAANALFETLFALDSFVLFYLVKTTPLHPTKSDRFQEATKENEV